MQKQYETDDIWEKSNNAYSLSIRDTVMSIFTILCFFLPQYQRQRKLSFGVNIALLRQCSFCAMPFSARALKKPNSLLVFFRARA